MLALVGSLLVMTLLIHFFFFVSDLHKCEFRVIWSIALCYVIFACYHGYGGPVNKFLSLPIWRPLSRLSFVTCLVHPLVMIALEVNMKNGLHFSSFAYVSKTIQFALY